MADKNRGIQGNGLRRNQAGAPTRLVNMGEIGAGGGRIGQAASDTALVAFRNLRRKQPLGNRPGNQSPVHRVRPNKFRRLAIFCSFCGRDLSHVRFQTTAAQLRIATVIIFPERSSPPL